MFDIGFTELLLVAVVALVVLGPERLPKAARFAGLWVRRARAQWYSVKSELERELAAEELKRNLQAAKESVQDAGRRIEDEAREVEARVREAGEDARREVEAMRREVVAGSPPGPAGEPQGAEAPPRQPDLLEQHPAEDAGSERTEEGGDGRQR
jgi:sec-independent protein translocase protein TatB